MPIARYHPHRRRFAPWRSLPCAVALLAALAAPPSQADALRAAARTIGTAAVAVADSVHELMRFAAEAGERERIDAVNDFVNRRIAFRDDIEVWGVADHWASPLQALARGEGDCEDYAIAKYFLLAAAGVPPARLRLVYVHAQLGARRQAHMVLAYYPRADALPLILDNLDAAVRPAGERADLAPVFSFNAEGLWQGIGAQGAGDPLQRLSRWRDVLVRARAEGFVLP